MPYINQAEFSYGATDPRVINKSNVGFYAQSAETIQNTLVTSLTNLKKRFGLQYVLPMTGIASGEYYGTEFIYNINVIYVLIFTNLQLKIYRNDVLKATIVTIWTGAQLGANAIKTSMTNNEMIIVDGPHIPYHLINGGNDTTWSLLPENFKNYPTYDFKKNYDSFSFSLSSVTAGQGITLTCSDDVFDATYVNGRFASIGSTASENAPVGSARITAYVTPKTVTVEVTNSFDGSLKTGTGTVSGKNCQLEQPAWSDAKGWPKSVCFYSGRAWYGGTVSLPNVVFGSVDFSYNDFDLGSGYDSDAVIQILDGSDGEPVGEIKYLLGDKSLQIFCERSEHAVSNGGGAISPVNFIVRRQSSEGISNMPPILFDNTTMFIKRGGKSLMTYNYDGNADIYASKNASKLASHLINNPVSIASLRSLSDDDESYLFIVNTDGTLAILTSDIDENIKAFTSQITDGKFKKVFSSGDDIYFIIERVIQNSTVQYLEKLNFDIYSDSSVIYTNIPATKTLTGLSHLNDKTVDVIGNGYVLKNHVVTAGSITLSDEEPAVTNAVVGLNFESLIVPHPPIIYGAQGSEYYINKRITRVFLHYYQTLGLKINGVEIPLLPLSEAIFDAPVPATGIFEFNGLSDWDPLTTVSITHNLPLPFTILGLGYEVTQKSEGV